MFQVLVKTMPHMNGSYAYDLGTREEAQEFVQRDDVWWWCFPLDEDVLDGSSWRKGGAWVTIAEEPGMSGLFPHQERAAAAPRPVPPLAAFAPSPEGEDDDRW